LTYTPDIPQTGESLGGTRDRIRTNFQQIDTVNSVNHVAFADSGSGKHKFLQMPEITTQTPNTPPSTAANEGALYTNPDSATTPKTALFFRTESDGDNFQLSGYGGLIPTILSGTFTSTGSFTAITSALPQNIYGTIYFWKTTSPFAVQTGQFFTSTTKAHGYSNRLVRNSSSDDDPIELQNNPSADLKLYGKTDDFGNITVNWRLHYWAV
jgi:hypothetical protein